MTKTEIQRNAIADLLKDGQNATWTELQAIGVERRAVLGMIASGELLRVDHNVYRLAAANPGKFPEWEDIAKKYSDFVVCLLSAAQFHGLTVHLPDQLWVGLPLGSKPTNLTVRCVQYPRNPDDRRWTVGVDTITDGTHSFNVTSRERTIVDLFIWRKRLPDGERFFAEAINEFDAQNGSRALLAKIGAEFGVDRAISERLVWKGHVENARSIY
ncbi:type IV toxin-antitoxin system AbiEi family antitoxin domain-containing protein [Thalassospira xianhensis]|uniref:Transcriptional regulator n=1 Tax=Thalassospira xianhensis MCCC 1A02616 TaxID=1177929 RepID=A0A367UJN6_9PROT|nr:type IV toxin-antitoxin system AbiEi family antitoxin domain-containing protein [Thalassospira xianhensis]RCK07853.1 hypothetical protein TH5_02190 [Thalassospira xianhensis MCCC 1A02616]